MRKEIIETGKTVDAAIEAACENLGCKREDCEWEIIDLPKKGFLGLKSYPAKVKVVIETPEAPPRAKPGAEHHAAPKRTEPRDGKPRETKRRETPRREAPAPAKIAREEEPAPRIEVTGGFTEKETAAMAYIDSILKQFGLTAGMKLAREGNGICIDIKGDGLGAIIGRRGETLDAIQYLTGLVANRFEGEYMRVTVDCGDYRNKRRETLEALARKLAGQVLKTNVSKILEPMNPFERRVIHATVSEIEGVSSSSVGEEPNRRVVITTPTARRPAPSRGGRTGGFDGDRRPPRDRDRDRDRGRGGKDRDRDRRRTSRDGPRPSAPPAPQGPPKQTPESEVMGGTPYGKLDLE